MGSDLRPLQLISHYCLPDYFVNCVDSLEPPESTTLNGPGPPSRRALKARTYSSEPRELTPVASTLDPQAAFLEPKR